MRSYLRWFSITILSIFVFPFFAHAGDTPNININYQWNNIPIQEGGSYDIQVGPPSRISVYTWPHVMFGVVYGSLYKGRIHENAVSVTSHQLGNFFQVNGNIINKVENGDSFPEPGDYFVVIWNGSKGLNATQENTRMQHWFESGTTVDPNAFSPGTWGIIKFHVGPFNTPPEISGLGQHKMFDAGALVEGETFIGNSAVLRAAVADTDSAQVQLEVEIKPVGTAFDGLNTILSDPATPGELSIDTGDLIPPPEQTPMEGYQAAFHWRARAVDNGGLTSAWQEFGAPDNADFVAHYTLGFAAATEARKLIDQPDAYELGARGWDYYLDEFVAAAYIIRGYNYKSGLTKLVEFGPGIDCSGLIYWAFNKSFDSDAADDNYVANITANGMFVEEKQSDPVSETELQPGDALFFDNDADPQIDHVALYVGDSGGYDIVNAGSEATGITREIKDILATSASGFEDYRRIHKNGFEGKIQSGSPVDLTITDPDGHVLSYSDFMSSAQEVIREIPGELYYSEIQKGHDGNPIDVVYLPTLKEGTYHVEVIPNPDASPSETYSLTFTAGETIVDIAKDALLSDIPENGYGIIVSEDGSITLDQIPPEARFSFNTATREIEVIGTDNFSVPTVVQSATSTVIADEAGNTLEFDVTRDVTQPKYAALVMPSFAYSTGSSTTATTSLRYFWVTDRQGAYSFFISAIKTPTDRLIAIYSKSTNKTYVVASTPEDDDADLSLKTVLLLLRKKLQTYSGLVIPSVSTNQGIIRVEI